RPHPHSAVTRDPGDVQGGEAVAADAGLCPHFRQGSPATVVVEDHRQAGETAFHLTHLSDLGNPPAAHPAGARVPHEAPPASPPTPGKSARSRCLPISTRAVRRLPP